MATQVMISVTPEIRSRLYNLKGSEKSYGEMIEELIEFYERKYDEL